MKCTQNMVLKFPVLAYFSSVNSSSLNLKLMKFQLQYLFAILQVVVTKTISVLRCHVGEDICIVHKYILHVEVMVVHQDSTTVSKRVSLRNTYPCIFIPRLSRLNQSERIDYRSTIN